jgi:oligoribonuclease NrnB/cAMP/cGMP phosphodiesterase (DHH superfamily)
MTESGESKTARIGSILSVSHEKDVDGIMASAIVSRYAKSKGMKFDVILTDYGSLELVFKKIGSRKNSIVVITDLGMDENLLSQVTSGLKRAISQGCKIVWLDHHNWSNRSMKAIVSLPNKPILRVNHDFCAAEIAFKTLMPRDEISAELARIAHDTDFNLREIEAATALADAVAVLRFAAIAAKDDMTEALRPLLTSLADGGLEEVWDDDSKRLKGDLLQKQVKNYRKERLKKMKRALKDHCDQNIHERLVRIVQIPLGITTTDIGTFMSKEENLVVDGNGIGLADLLLTLTQGGMLGFRRGSETVLCDMAAKLFKGGGHPYAAGGEYGPYESFQEVCSDIFLTLTENKSWLSNNGESN